MYLVTATFWFSVSGYHKILQALGITFDTNR